MVIIEREEGHNAELRVMVGHMTMRAIHGIALIGVSLVISGLMIVEAQTILGSVGFPISPDWGFVLVSFGGDILLVYCVVDTLVLRDERNRWRAVEKQVKELIGDELLDVLVTTASESVGLMVGLEMNPAWPTINGLAMLNKMRELGRPENRAELRKSWVVQALFDGKDRPFHDKARSLQNLQLRYSARLSDPAQVNLMITLERQLESLDTDLSYVRDKKMQLIMGEQYKEYKEATIDNYLTSLQDLMATVVKAADDRLIRFPLSWLIPPPPRLPTE